MNLGTIVTPNQKGQIVIPKKIRDKLNISPHTPLRLILTGHTLSLQPIQDVVTLADYETSYLSLLKKTQGAWQNDPHPTLSPQNRQLELKQTQKNKQLKW